MPNEPLNYYLYKGIASDERSSGKTFLFSWNLHSPSQSQLNTSKNVYRPLLQHKSD